MPFHSITMNVRYFPAILFAAFVSFACPATARLGDTEAQSQARYGEPTPQYASPTDKPLMAGAKEVIYFFQGWRVRAAFANNATVRIEYAHVPEGAVPKNIDDAEAKAILDAEKGTFSWREQKPKTGDKNLNALKTFFDGQNWERGDHATATLKLKLLLVLESRDADAIEKKLAKLNGAGKPAGAPVVPKF